MITQHYEHPPYLIFRWLKMRRCKVERLDPVLKKWEEISIFWILFDALYIGPDTDGCTRFWVFPTSKLERTKWKAQLEFRFLELPFRWMVRNRGIYIPIMIEVGETYLCSFWKLSSWLADWAGCSVHDYKQSVEIQIWIRAAAGSLLRVISEFLFRKSCSRKQSSRREYGHSCWYGVKPPSINQKIKCSTAQLHVTPSEHTTRTKDKHKA